MRFIDSNLSRGEPAEFLFSSLEKCVVLQANDAAVSSRLVIFGSKVQLFYTQITEHTLVHF
jgi:hypothetical protein